MSPSCTTPSTRFEVTDPTHASALATAFTNLLISNLLIRHIERNLITAEIRLISPAAATERLQLHKELCTLMTKGSAADEDRAVELQGKILAIERGIGDWIARGQIGVYREVVRRVMRARQREWEGCGLLKLGRRRVEAGLDVMNDVFGAWNKMVRILLHSLDGS